MYILADVQQNSRVTCKQAIKQLINKVGRNLGFQ